MCREKFLSSPSARVRLVHPVPGYPRGVPGPSDRETLEMIVGARDATGDSWGTAGKPSDPRAPIAARYPGACGSALSREFPSLTAALESARRLSVSVSGALHAAMQTKTGAPIPLSDVTVASLHTAIVGAYDRFAGHFGGGPLPGKDPVEGKPYSFDTPSVRVVLTPISGGRFRVDLGMAAGDSWTGFEPFRGTSSLRAAGLLAGWRLLA